MKTRGFFYSFLLSAACLISTLNVQAEEVATTEKEVDICIYGSSPAGIMAAYTAKLKGKSVLLISTTKRLGGLTTGGLGWTDIGDSTSHRRIIKGFARELKTIVRPRQVKKITIDNRPVDHEVVRSVNAYIICYVVIFVISLLAISFEDHDLVTNFTAITATLNNIGPGLRGVGPTANYGDFSVFSKLVLIFDMLAGRLELFPMLILFTPSTYKKL